MTSIYLAILLWYLFSNNFTIMNEKIFSKYSDYAYVSNNPLRNICQNTSFF